MIAPENLDEDHLLAFQWSPRKSASSWDCIANTSASDCDCNKEIKTGLLDEHLCVFVVSKVSC